MMVLNTFSEEGRNVCSMKHLIYLLRQRAALHMYSVFLFK